MVLKWLYKKFNWEATLIAIEVLIEYLAKLFTLRQLAAIDQQVALDQADQVLSHFLRDLSWCLLDLFWNAVSFVRIIVIVTSSAISPDFLHIEM